jgi:adenylate cyclase
MDDGKLAELAEWLTQAGIAGEAETNLVTGFCERCVEAGLPLSRCHVLIDTLHPVHEGRVFRWGQNPDEPSLHAYGRTTPVGGVDAAQAEAIAQWRRSPFFRMVETGASLLRRRLTAATDEEFGQLADLRAAGMTDYVAIINRFAPEGTIGDMDCVYSSWWTRRTEGFDDAHIAALKRLAPSLALSVKSAALTHTLETLMRTYLGHDAARRVLDGRIVRGVADRIDAVIWFSDLQGFTRITDTAPSQVIPLLNDYSDVIVSAIHEHGGDVLKLMGDGTLAIFTAGGRGRACSAALAAADTAQRGIAELNRKRADKGLPVTGMYLGLNVGEVLYGNVGSRDRLDFTVVGPAVNEVSRIAAMCRSLEQPILTSAAFASVDDIKDRLVSVGRYALRGVATPQELFTLDRTRAG